MVSEVSFPERRARLRPLSRPSQLALAVGALAALSGCVTYALLTGLTPYTPTRTGLAVLLLVNLTLVLTLGALIAWRVVRLWAERRSGRAGAKLHVRLVTWFSAIAVVPVILVAIFAAITLNLGLEAWFSDRVKTALGSAVNVAQVYVKEHETSIINDVSYIADALQSDPQLFDEEKHVRAGRLFAKLGTVTQNRGLQAAYILDGKGRVLGSTKQQSVKDPPPPKPADITASRDSVVLDTPDNGTVTALVQLHALNDAYLEVVRVVDPKVFGYYLRTKAAVGEYNRLDENRSEVALVFAALYAVVSLAILLAAIWFGLWAANRLVRPISSLIDAAEKVSEGDLTAHVRVAQDDDELGTLGEAFNRMTHQLSAQREDLIAAGRQIDIRRRFTETVLSGVSAGVLGLDREGRITIVNRAAARLLDSTPEDMEGAHYAEAIPELAALVRRAIGEPVGHAGGEVTLKRGGKTRTLSVQVSSEATAESFVVTFDDITDLVSAQRTAAWADVARRIAHEIKNPLTPIQLSAERLKRKYSGEITSDPETFQQCTDTIVRQVGDIGRMVDEFSSFARMPTPVMRRENAQELVQQAVFLQRVGNPGITFTTALPKEPVYFEGDGRLISQALTNVLKNAGEGIAARIARGDDEPGRIEIALERNGATFAYRITDNGVGLPPEHRHRLTEPYVTTRAKGTGLGLAIVRKIMEDHGGDIALGDCETGEGAQVILTFPFTQKQPEDLNNKGSEDEQERIADRV
ncbi:MAG: PAS domain-containing sensor histidine kinase [Alphaproteobacteria bacterium]|nr:PAS domain-containing sensor histidine kinase [Alphaproteobacteria bacterium]